MRKTIYLIAFMTAVIFNSCTSDSSSVTPINESDLIGTWTLKLHTLNGSQIANSGEIYKFAENHNVRIAYPQDGNVFEYGTWSLTENKLLIHNNSANPEIEYMHLEILKLTATELTWQLQIPDEGLLIENFSR